MCGECSIVAIMAMWHAIWHNHAVAQALRVARRSGVRISSGRSAEYARYAEGQWQGRPLLFASVPFDGKGPTCCEVFTMLAWRLCATQHCRCHPFVLCITQWLCARASPAGHLRDRHCLCFHLGALSACCVLLAQQRRS